MAAKKKKKGGARTRPPVPARAPTREIEIETETETDSDVLARNSRSADGEARAVDAADEAAPPPEPRKKAFRELPRPLPQPVFPSENAWFDNPLTLAILLAVGLGVLIGLTWSHGQKAAEPGGPLTAVPKESFLVARVDVPTLRASPLYAAVLGDDVASKSLGLGELARGCRFDPLGRVEDLVVAIPEGEAKGTFGVAAHVRLSESELATCAERLTAARGTKTTPKTVGSFHVLEASLAAGGERGAPGLAFREGGLLVVAEGTWLASMLAAAEGTHARALEKDVHGDLVKALLADPALAHPTIVATAVLPTSLRERLKTELSQELATATAGATSEDSPEAIMGAVLSVAGAGLAISARPGEELSARIELLSENEGAPKVLARLVERKRFGWAKDIAIRLVGLGSAVDSITASPHGPGLSVTVHAPIEDLSRGVARVLEYGKKQTAPPEPAPKSDAPKRAPDEIVPSKRDSGKPGG